MRRADVLAERADRGVLDGAAEVGAGVELAGFGAAGAEHRPDVFEIVGEGDVLVFGRAEGGNEFERVAGPEGRDGAGQDAVDLQAAARDRGAAAGPQGELDQPVGSPGPPENSWPSVGFRITSPSSVWEM